MGMRCCHPRKGPAMTELLVTLITVIVVGGYGWFYERPRYKARQRQRLEEAGYGFLNRDD